MGRRITNKVYQRESEISPKKEENKLKSPEHSSGQWLLTDPDNLKPGLEIDIISNDGPFKGPLGDSIVEITKENLRAYVPASLDSLKAHHIEVERALRKQLQTIDGLTAKKHKDSTRKKNLKKKVSSKNVRSSQLPQDDIFERVSNIANDLSIKYGVEVGIVETDIDYYSDKLIKQSVSDNRYYISLQNPEDTAKITAHIIKRDQERQKLESIKKLERKLELLEQAHDVRTEKSARIAQELAPKIDEIIRHHSPNGKSLSLSAIARILNDGQVPSPSGEPKWYAQTVKRIIKGEPHKFQK